MSIHYLVSALFYDLLFSKISYCVYLKQKIVTFLLRICETE